MLPAAGVGLRAGAEAWRLQWLRRAGELRLAEGSTSGPAGVQTVLPAHPRVRVAGVVTRERVRLALHRGAARVLLAVAGGLAAAITWALLQHPASVPRRRGPKDG